jgi:gamma-glutamylputrescine oxidase
MSDRPDPPSSTWWAEPFAERPPLSGTADADVAIVGGGITGVTLAWTLAERDVRVVVVEAAQLAGAASGRNAGFLMSAPAEPYAESIAMYGRAGARAVLHTGQRNHRRIRQLVATLGLDCGHRVNGSVRLARTPEEADDQRASLPLLREDGCTAAEVPVRDVVPGKAADAFVAAFLDPDDGELHPVRFVRGLADAAVARGARIYEHTPVVAATATADAWELATPGGRVRARTVVLATNAYLPQLAPPLEPLVKPRRAQMLATAPVGRIVAPHPTYAHWGYQYWRQLGDGRLLIGGWRDTDLDGETGYDDAPTERIQSAIESGLRELVPEGVAIERRWAGTMGFSRDGRPLVGWLDADRHLAVCAGFTGHGMGKAAACTEALADLLDFRAADAITTFAPGRFPELARYTGPFLPVG